MRKRVFTLLMSLPLIAGAQNLRVTSSTLGWLDSGVGTSSSAESKRVVIDSICYLLAQYGSEKTATVTYENKDENGKYRSSYAGDVVIPEKVKHKGKTYRVSAVGKGAFANCQGLTSVTLPAGLESIGNTAFGNSTGLQTIHIPNSVQRIGDAAFYGCLSLSEVVFDEDTTSLPPLELGASAFQGCRAMEQICIRKTPQPLLLPSMVFAECRNLRTFSAAGSVAGVGSKAFLNCTSLAGIDFSNMKGIALDAFEGCTGFSEEDTAKWQQIRAQIEEALENIPVESAKFPGDVYGWLNRNIVYPADCKKKGIDGRVSVEFIIEADGDITDVKVLRSPNKSLSEEAMRVVKSMPKWIPALNSEGKPVRMRYVLPVMFRRH